MIEIIGWIAIAGATTLAFGVISFLVYSKWENETSDFAILIIGFIVGAILGYKNFNEAWNNGMAFRNSKNILIDMQ